MCEEGKTCCFIGHRNVTVTEELWLAITRVVERLVEDEGVRTFIFGARSDFDAICYAIVKELRLRYPVLKRITITCRSECLVPEDPDLDIEIVHKHAFTAGQASYVERNQTMIDMSDFCVFYYDPNYRPPERHCYDSDRWSTYQPNSGTAAATNMP